MLKKINFRPISGLNNADNAMKEDFYMDSFIEEFEKEIFNNKRKIIDTCGPISGGSLNDSDLKNSDQNLEKKFDEKNIICDILSDEFYANNFSNNSLHDFLFCYNEKLTANKTFSSNNNPVFNIVHKNNDKIYQLFVVNDLLPKKNFTVVNSNYVIFNGSLSEGEKILLNLGMEKDENLIKTHFKKI